MLDVIVFGATGESGRAACAYLFTNGAVAGIRSWAPAARNLGKIQQVLGSILKAEPPAHGVSPSTPIVADSMDHDAMVAMAKQAKVILACAGPFAEFGEGVVKACIEAGADYIDITGEMHFVERMSRKYGEAAKKKGVRLISFGGYDSIPSDLSTYMAVKAIKDVGKEVARVETFHRLAGGFMPAGTFNTVLAGTSKIKSKLLSMVTLGMIAPPPRPKRDANESGSGFVPSEVRSSVQKSLTANFYMGYSSLRGGFSALHFMSFINTPVVHTTAHKLGYGGFTYCERLEAAKPSVSNLYGFIPAAIVVSCYIAAFFLPLIPGMMGLILNYRKKNDAARLKMLQNLMDNDFQSSGMTKVMTYGVSKDGSTKSEVTFHSNHDAGLGFTAKCMVTIAGLMVAEARQGKGTGFGTAVADVGAEKILVALRKAGVTITDAKLK
eukprot:m.30243 g.30243  ORF g.30243 m.30243 type:complete len:438 (-) comp16241_c0_seq1:88-1401(-)